jgi:hypothetical protein
MVSMLLVTAETNLRAMVLHYGAHRSLRVTHVASYRANLHFCGAEFYLCNLHVYCDYFPQPFLTDTVKVHGN